MKREDVINELNELIHDSPERLSIEVMNGLKDALAYIEERKEQDDSIFESGVEKGREDALKPRILNLEEAFDSDIVFYESRCVHDSGYGEISGNGTKFGVVVERVGIIGYVLEDERDYGSAWRCWDKKPNEEQRKSEPWKE